MKISTVLIGPDHIIRIPVMLFSILTGSPQLLLNGEPIFTIPSPPRPTQLFPEEYLSHRKLDEVLKSSIIPSPLETPTYYSLSKCLKAELGPLVRQGSLGFVEGGDYLLFVSSQMNAIVQIVEKTVSHVSFVLRGLEYSGQMSCHEREIESLDDVSFLTSQVTAQKRLSSNLVLRHMEATKIEFGQALLNPYPDLWMRVYKQLLNKGDEELNEEETEKWVYIKSALFNETSINGNGLIELFDSSDQITRETVRLGSVACLYANSDFLSETDDIIEILNRIREQNIICNIKDIELDSDRQIITVMNFKGNGSFVMFNVNNVNWRVFGLNRELVRGLWVNEARSQLFMSIQAPERNSIQKSVPLLRNMINQSCMFPLGYPAFVSPVLHSPVFLNKRIY